MMAGVEPEASDLHGEGDAIDIVFQHPSLRVDTDRLRLLLERVLDARGADLKQLTVVLADHDTVLDLNRRFLDHDYNTDVLAFDYAQEEDVIDGEVYVDLDTAQERCWEFNAAFDDETLRYAVHGLLHLMGYSDKTPAGAKEMKALENRYLDEATT